MQIQRIRIGDVEPGMRIGRFTMGERTAATLLGSSTVTDVQVRDVRTKTGQLVETVVTLIFDDGHHWQDDIRGHVWVVKE